MKLVSFRYQGRETYGAVVGAQVSDFAAVAGARAPDLKSAVAAGLVKELAAQARPVTALVDVTLLPPITNPEKIFCVGLNYHTHRLETGRKETDHPVIFTRFADTHVGQGAALLRPRASGDFDYEGELAIIIGKKGRAIAPGDAMSYVAGYSCYNDGSIRDWQMHTHQYTPGKNFPESGAFGPWMVTADEIPDPTRLTIVTRLNGEELQHASTGDMIFSIPDIIAYVSGFTRLSPGDVIATGTPGGVGFKRQPPVYMKAGDMVEVEISSIGILKNPVAAEA